MTNNVNQWQPKNLDITMTKAAIEHVQKQIDRQGHGIGMRFGIRKSGCSGHAYDVQIIDESNDDDKIYNLENGLILAVMPQHLPILQGTEIDYIRDGVNFRFQFNNPNETNSCGCGESFTTD